MFYRSCRRRRSRILSDEYFLVEGYLISTDMALLRSAAPWGWRCYKHVVPPGQEQSTKLTSSSTQHKAQSTNPITASACIYRSALADHRSIGYDGTCSSW